MHLDEMTEALSQAPAIDLTDSDLDAMATESTAYAVTVERTREDRYGRETMSLDVTCYRAGSPAEALELHALECGYDSYADARADGHAWTVERALPARPSGHRVRPAPAAVAGVFARVGLDEI